MKKSGKNILKITIVYVFAIILIFGLNDGNGKVNGKITESTNSVDVGTTTQKNYEGLMSTEDIINEMTLEEKVGQMFFCAKCSDSQADSAVKDYHAGGLLLYAQAFGKNEEDSNSGYGSDTMIERISTYQNNAKVPVFIGVDEEGGTVTRVSRYTAYGHEKFKSPKELFQEGGKVNVLSDCEEKCDFLKKLGINVNFAPVCDVSTDKNSFMYNRSFSDDVEETSEYVSEIVKRMNNKKMGSVLKHFPGYGDNEDSHKETTVCDTRSEGILKENDMKPFKRGIEAGANCILMSHTIVRSLDEDYPVSLSEDVHAMLRGEMGYQGVIITDNTDMETIKNYCASDEKVAIQAVQAGNDMIISSEYKVQIQAVISAVNDGTIREERIDESVERILNWKRNLGLIGSEQVAEY